MNNSHTTAAKTAAVFVVLITLFFTPLTTFAQVEVVESNPIIRPIGQSPGVTPAQPGQDALANNPMDQLFAEIQTLRQQVQQQTGLIEELSFEVRRLKQQRMEDYTDLDRRISELGRGGGVTSPNDQDLSSSQPSTLSSPTGTARSSATPPATSAAASRDETSVYRAANDLISAREWDKAIAALNAYLQDFPGGRYESNAHYWIGELYLVKDDLPKARAAFEKVIRDYPDSNKVDASKFKLGRIHFQQGDKARAKELLEDVASTNNDSSRQAALFLRENF